MSHRPDPDAETAAQYLMWALEFIEKTGDHKAARHARIALDAMRQRSNPYKTGEPPQIDGQSLP
jgi:hypothetical protein